MSTTQFLGKYRGIVSDNKDPNQIGRIRAHVPDVFGDGDSGWALPCLPFTGGGCGFFALPPIGSLVWIEFEHGEPEYPIWVGGWWETSSDLPQGVYPDGDQKVLIQTNGGHCFLMDDTSSGGITLKTSGGFKIVMDTNAIEITNGAGATIKLSSSQVSVNDGALEVT